MGDLTVVKFSPLPFTCTVFSRLNTGPPNKHWVQIKAWFTTEVKLWYVVIRNTVKPVLSGHPRDLPKCLLNRGCPLNRGSVKISQCLKINFQQCLYKVPGC